MAEADARSLEERRGAESHEPTDGGTPLARQSRRDVVRGGLKFMGAEVSLSGAGRQNPRCWAFVLFLAWWILFGYLFDKVMGDKPV